MEEKVKKEESITSLLALFLSVLSMSIIIICGFDYYTKTDSKDKQIEELVQETLLNKEIMIKFVSTMKDLKVDVNTIYMQQILLEGGMIKYFNKTRYTTFEEIYKARKSRWDSSKENIVEEFDMDFYDSGEIPRFEEK